MMLDEVIERVVTAIVDANDNISDEAEVLVCDLQTLLRAARLLKQIHEMADKGDVDFVDLDWMADTDLLITGE